MQQVHLQNLGRVISMQQYIFPERNRIMDSEPEHSNGIRRMLIDNYSVFYVIKEDRVNYKFNDKQ